MYEFHTGRDGNYSVTEFKASDLRAIARMIKVLEDDRQEKVRFGSEAASTILTGGPLPPV
jgi:hypothetical protein